MSVFNEKNYRVTNEELFDFINKSPSPYHAIDNLRAYLLENGYEELAEKERWDMRIQEGGKYFTTRNYSSIIAFEIPEKECFPGFNITAAHSDSPTFKIKEIGEMKAEGNYTKLNVENYGGMIMSTWFDKPLSIAGRVIAKEAGIDKDDILSSDLFLYNRQKGCFVGADEEFIMSPKLDDLQCAFSEMKALVESDKSDSIKVSAVFDNEEVGSGTKQGACSTFLFDTLSRINYALGGSQEDFIRRLSDSFMVSCDNAHAVHPNYPEKMDPTNKNYLNKGLVIKFNANQKYTTDGISSALFKRICERADAPYQTFHNRSDMAGGSTLGNLSNAHVSLNTVDIGIPQLAMHSSCETAGAKDTYDTVKALKEFFEVSVTETANGEYSIF